MLPNDVVRCVATFLPAEHARVVELVWRPKLGRDFYDALYDRDGYTTTVRAPNSGILYIVHTKKYDERYRSTVARSDTGLAAVVSHGYDWKSARAACAWLLDQFFC